MLGGRLALGALTGRVVVLGRGAGARAAAVEHDRGRAALQALGAPAESHLHACAPQLARRRAPDRLGERARVKADVAGVRSGEQPAAEHERPERQRGVGRRAR